jgi:hypothetical protein
MAHVPPSTPSARADQGPTPAFKPYVLPTESVPEFTLKAIVLGAIFGIIFGAVTVYLALRAGLTVSASIPIAVLAIAVFKRFGRSTILENNIVQTIGSAGESVAAGVVFTIPGLPVHRERRRAGVLQHPADRHAGGGRRHHRRADDGAHAPRAHREGARGAAVPRGHGLRRGADRGRARRRDGEDGLRRLLDRHGLLGREQALRALARGAAGDRHRPGARLPERHADERDHPGVPGRGLHHRPADRRDHGLGLGAVVAGAHPAALDAGPGADGARRPDEARVHAGLDRREQPGQLDLPRVRALHRRGRRGHGGPHHARPDAADDLRLDPRLAAGAGRRRRRRRRARARSGTSRSRGWPSGRWPWPS